MEYTLEMTSQEEGVVVDLPLPPSAPQSSGDHNDAAAPGGADTPSDEEDDAAAEGGGSPGGRLLVNETAEATGGDARVAAPPRTAERVQSGARRRHQRTTTDGGSATNGGAAANSNGYANDNDDPPPSTSPSYYTKQPHHRSYLPHPLSFAQRLREYRHTPCLMTPLSALVLLALLLTSLVTLALTVPQLLVGMVLGPLVQRHFWLVEFLYRYDVARWGHVKIMAWAGKGKKSPSEKGTQSNHSEPSAKSLTAKLEGHSNTVGQRTTVVPGRVYVHPLPQFVDNVAYLIVATPPPTKKTLPIVGVVVDCGDAAAVLQHTRAIYERHYVKDYPRSALREDKGCGTGIDICMVLCTHRHHDHTAGVGRLKKEVAEMRRTNFGGTGKTLSVTAGCSNRGNGERDVYAATDDHFVVAGAAVERVPHCTLFVKNGCFVPLPCVSFSDDSESKEAHVDDAKEGNDMNALVSIEVIGVPSHTRGSVVYALRNRAAPGLAVPVHSDPMQGNPPLQSHLFTGDAIFTGGGGVPFEADLESARDNFVKHPKRLQKKHGGSAFRPGAGTLSMERCFAEVVVRAAGPWSAARAGTATPPQDATLPTPSTSRLGPPVGSTLLYPGHEYTTDLLMRQFDQKTVPTDVHWTRLAPSVFFETASHYLVSAHRRSLPPHQKLLTIPSPLEREVVINTHFRMLKRRGECAVHALRLWYEFGAKELIPDVEEEGSHDDAPKSQIEDAVRKRSVFTTVYSADLAGIVEGLRSGDIDATSAADRIDSLKGRLDEKMIGRRPIPSTLPSHKNVYLGTVALAVLGSPPSAVTSSDATIMDMASPVDSTDRIVISKRRLISALEGMGLLSEDTSPRLQDIIQLLWQEARLDDELKLDIEQPNGTDVECSIQDPRRDDGIELGLLKLALFGVSLGQQSKLCMPCGGSRKPQYDDASWVKTSKLRRTNGELVRHDADSCPLCTDVIARCPHVQTKAVAT